MIDSSRVDFGSVQIHKRAIADITFSALNEIEGVSLVPNDVISKVRNYFGDKHYSGIIVSIDKNSQVAIEVKVRVRYGIAVQDVARQVQEAVRTAVERTVDITLRDVNVNVHGIERGSQ